jgi:peptide/nickel transport system ATP-binding protein
MTQELLDIQDLYINFKIYEGNLKVLNGVNLKLGKGEKLGLIGEAGCGKTTTMKSILRILPQPAANIPSGKIIFEGKDVMTLNRKSIENIRRSDISMIFQDPTAALNPVFKVGELIGDIIKYSAIASGEKLSKQEIKKRSIDILGQVALPDPKRLLDNYPVQLSGGMKQRVCIAMSLISANKLLIADEPTTNLDVTIADQILRLIGNLVKEKGTSLILISHALGAVKGVVDRVAVMYAGNIIENSNKQDLFNNPKHPYTQNLIKAVPKLTGGGISEGISGRLPNYLDSPKGCRFYPRCTHAMPICQEKFPPFYDIESDHKVACFLYKR